MISFQPSGVVSGKQNICICDNCTDGYLYRCTIEQGKIFCGRDIVDEEEDDDSDSEDENEHEEESDTFDEHEQMLAPM